MEFWKKNTWLIFIASLLYLKTFGECEFESVNIRHKYQKALAGITTQTQANYHLKRHKNKRRANDHLRHASIEEDDSIPDPHLLDPKDVAVYYQLQTVTQPPIESNPFNETGKPAIVEPPSRYISTRAGQTAALTCVVKNLGDRQVSWIRGRDLHVLSSGMKVFASDSRVRVTVVGTRWSLIIRYSQPRDGGTYTCQINTKEPVALTLNLTVVEARAIIESPSTLYIQEGSTITLICKIKEELVIPGLVLWYHGDALVPRDSDRIKVVTDTPDITISVLNITGANTKDSGNYSCWPSSGKPDTAFVHVIQGEAPAAMHHGNGSPKLHSSLCFLPAVILWSYIFLYEIFTAIPKSRKVDKIGCANFPYLLN